MHTNPLACVNSVTGELWGGKWEITDHIYKGMQVVYAKKVVLPVEEEAHEIKATDLVRGSLTGKTFLFVFCTAPVCNL
jgi:hypothetical protein